MGSVSLQHCNDFSTGIKLSTVTAIGNPLSVSSFLPPVRCLAGFRVNASRWDLCPTCALSISSIECLVIHLVFPASKYFVFSSTSKDVNGATIRHLPCPYGGVP
ncbi:unnamed protein product [Pylaiella littoralis]